MAASPLDIDPPWTPVWQPGDVVQQQLENENEHFYNVVLGFRNSSYQVLFLGWWNNGFGNDPGWRTFGAGTDDSAFAPQLRPEADDLNHAVFHSRLTEPQLALLHLGQYETLISLLIQPHEAIPTR